MQIFFIVIQVPCSKLILWISLLIFFGVFLYPMYLMILDTKVVYIWQNPDFYNKRYDLWKCFPLLWPLRDKTFFLKIVLLTSNNKTRTKQILNAKVSKYMLAQYKETGILFTDDAKLSATFKWHLLVLTQCRAGVLLRTDSQTLGHAVSQPCSRNSPFVPWHRHWFMNLTSIAGAHHK